ncbi:uncharacterized protein LOC106131742 [Amyelois transitella]|uniref:uncharacterized protein LOC106131742 n=1 Tax=Amyelois transitella TaxID=680683 RepID=UPI00067B286F|nr:uncharacterized protein LOC106131742 [Amyelois transitella]XP_013186388.1 uncharacterized protein LOC106131742 [Amyelois transitella]
MAEPAEQSKSLTHISPALTKEALSEALTKWFGEKTVFTHWEYVGNTGKGDSYLSDLIRIKIFGESQNTTKFVQVILKTIPKNGIRRITYRSHEFFKNEINFYTKVLPALLKFQSSKNIPEPFDKHCKVFFSYCDGTNDVLSLEDESLHGYGPTVRQKGLDYNHCKMMFKVLAQFHALSFAMKDQLPKEFDEISNHIFETYYHERLRDWYSRFWNRICGIAIDAVEKEYPDSVYLEKVKSFASPERYDDLIEAATNTKNTGVISHGDSWTNNFLFKFVDSIPVAAKIIDFQLCRYATPILDVSFVIYACTTQDLREQYYGELINYYYEVLAKQISDMGSDPNNVYSKELFLAELKKYSYFGLAFSFESTPVIVLSADDAIDMEIEDEKGTNIDDWWQLTPFKTKEGRLREANNIVHCVDNGYI